MDNLIKLPQIYATSYFMIHSIDICDMLTNLKGFNKQVNVTFKFTKIFPFGENWQFGPYLAQDLRKAISWKSAPQNFILRQINKNFWFLTCF